MAGHGITRVADVTDLDVLGIPVVMVIRPLGRTLSVAQGKGVTLVDARASGVMEAIECDVAERWTPPVRRGTRQGVGGRSLDPVSIGAAHGAGNAQLEWVVGEDLVTGEPVHVPLEPCRLDAVLTEVPRRFAQDSNGLAGGATVVDATIHALCELLERDARAQADAQTAPVIDPAALADPELDRMLGACARAGVDAELVDLTGAARIPVVGARLVDRGLGRLPPLRDMRGHGCHPVPAAAVRRALTEAAQSRLTVIAGSRDDLDPRHWLPPRDLPVRVPRPGHMPPAAPLAADLAGTVALLVAAARRAGATEVVRVRMSPPGHPAAVVRVLAPGLAGMAAVTRVEGGPAGRVPAEPADGHRGDVR